MNTIENVSKLVIRQDSWTGEKQSYNVNGVIVTVTRLYPKQPGSGSKIDCHIRFLDGQERTLTARFVSQVNKLIGATGADEEHPVKPERPRNVSSQGSNKVRQVTAVKTTEERIAEVRAFLDEANKTIQDLQKQIEQTFTWYEHDIEGTCRKMYEEELAKFLQDKKLAEARMASRKARIALVQRYIDTYNDKVVSHLQSGDMLTAQKMVLVREDKMKKAEALLQILSAKI
jgi:multidrug efflux pump subunit AcrA (membrane-fusion protein)